MTWAEMRVEMQARIDPRLALLPETLQDLIRSSRYYKSPSNMGRPRVYVSEIITDAAELLFKTGVTNSNEVLDAVWHPQFEVREAARSLVGWLQWRRAAPSLLRQFEKQIEEREAIGNTLAQIHSRRARKRLLKWMTSSPDAEFRWEAAFALGQSNARKALPRLREMAEADHEIEHNNTCWPLAEIISWIE